MSKQNQQNLPDGLPPWFPIGPENPGLSGVPGQLELWGGLPLQGARQIPQQLLKTPKALAGWAGLRAVSLVRPVLLLRREMFNGLEAPQPPNNANNKNSVGPPADHQRQECRRKVFPGRCGARLAADRPSKRRTDAQRWVCGQ